MEGSAEVSVVIPSRDRWDLLENRALKAALLQETVSVEVIVVDDGSVDAPPRTGRLEDPRVRLVRHDRSRGVASARNTGIGVASAPWIAFLDDDDVWAPQKLTSVLQAIRLADADLGYSDVVVVDGELRPLSGVRGPSPAGLLTELLRQSAVPAGSSNIVARASLLERCGGFDEAFSVAADWDMWLRLAESGRAARADEMLVAYRTASWVLRSESTHRADIERFMDKHGELAREHGISVSWLAYERWVAYEMYVSGHRRAAARRYLATALRHRDPGSMVRAAGTLLSPDWADRLRHRPPPPAPVWLDLYREPVPGR
jgi:glycosyltransferase involved in cell wall biosynthesis